MFLGKEFQKLIDLSISILSDLDVYISFTDWNIYFKVLLCIRRIKQWPESRQHSANHVISN